MATYQNDFKVKNSLVVRNTATISNLDNIQTFSFGIALSPTLNLNFNKLDTIDPRVSFVRGTGATYIGKDSYIKSAGINVPRIDYSTTSTGTCLGLLVEEQRTNHFLNFGAISGCTRATGTNVVLKFTPLNPTAMTIKVRRTAITI